MNEKLTGVRAYRRTIALLLVLLSSAYALTLAFNVKLVKASGTIYIRANGQVDPRTAPIQRDKDLYTFTDNINDSIVVEKDSIAIDGAGHTLQGTGAPLSKGIDLSNRTNVIIKNMEIKAFYYGVDLSGSSNSIVQGNSITNNTHGIWLVRTAYEPPSDNNTIYGNNITRNKDFGIWLGFCSNNNVSNNNIADNYRGIGFEWSSKNTLRNNNITNNRYNFMVLGGTVSTFVNDVDTSNTVDGKPIYYWINRRDMAVPLDAGYVILVNCTGITVQNLDLRNNGQGLLLVYATNSTMTTNSMANNEYGIHLVHSSSNVISGNNVTCNIRGFLYDQSSNNSLTENNIANNECGIWLDESSNNEFYHNNFTNNTQQVSIERFGGCVNVWDDGYPSGGNYWSDYAGVDEDGDGIGDTSYVIDEANEDRYPLIAGSPSNDTTPPTISILSPENKTYSVNDVLLTFTVSESTSWIGYSLNGQMNMTITGNITMSELSEGFHSLIVYASDTAGNMGCSDLVYFSIETHQAAPFPMWIVAIILIITGIGVALVVYFAKFNPRAEVSV